MDGLTKKLIGCTDAQVWAHVFVKLVEDNPSIPTDEGTMIGWFANAIMAGYDEGQVKERQRPLLEKIHEVVYQAAGAATLPFMQDHPEDVMLTERVIEGVEAVLKDFGIPVRERESVSVEGPLTLS